MLKAKSIYTLLLFLVSLTVSLGLAELITRKLLKTGLDVWDERNLMYRHDPLLGWFPKPNGDFSGKGDRIRHNSRGFRDIEHLVDQRRGVVVLGDSFVWGYGVDQEARFTDKLRTKLRDFPVYNLGVSGYGTDQEYLLLQREFDFYRPGIVFLEFTTDNDEEDNSTDMRYGTYFKPYFRADGDKLKLCGVPVPLSLNYFIAGRSISSRSYLVRLVVKTYYNYAYPPPKKPENPTRAIIRNMNSFVRGKGAILMVGLQQRSPALEKFMSDEHIPYVDLTTTLTYADPGRHWTAAGHTFVADKIYNFIVSGRYLQKSGLP